MRFRLRVKSRLTIRSSGRRSIACAPQTLRCRRRLTQALGLMNELHGSSRQKRATRWATRALLGLLLSLVAVPGLTVSGFVAFAFSFGQGAPLLTRCIAAAIFLLCLGALSLGFRLMDPVPTHTGLLSPFALRLGAVLMAIPPIFLIVTGKSGAWSPHQYAQAFLFVLVASGMLWAARHKAAGLKREA